MKLIIQIPCFNEEQSLPIALGDIPRAFEGIDEVELLVIDDGSSDKTSDVAKSLGVHHIVRFRKNRGLARAFVAGLEASLKAGADIIVNTDADNQYYGADIQKLVTPIVNGQADIVIGARPIMETQDFSIIKKYLQRLGSWVVRRVSRTGVEDAPSGFRAMSRAAAQQLRVFSDYTYTLETIIQAGYKGLEVLSVPIRTHSTLRPSRLVKSIRGYVTRSLVTIARIFVTYRPFRTFAVLGLTVLSCGMLLGLRFVYFYLMGQGQGKIQSLLLAAIFILLGFACLMAGLLADIISVNRKLLEEVLWRLWQIEDSIEKKKKG